MTDSTWTADDLAAVVGVIDLQSGVAVHAVAGQRARYAPVHIGDGNPLRLVEHYVSLGVTSLYVADLSAIEKQQPCFEQVEQIAASVGGSVWLDFGWTGEESERTLRWIARLTQTYPALQFIAATESARGLETPGELAALVGPDRTWLGMDYRNGELLGVQSDEQRWLDEARVRRFAGVVPLDLAAVGTGSGPATELICRRIRVATPQLRMVSGGGVATAADARRLREAGCERVLVASALLSLA